jgi:hypothetical protein
VGGDERCMEREFIEFIVLISADKGYVHNTMDFTSLSSLMIIISSSQSQLHYIVIVQQQNTVSSRPNILLIQERTHSVSVPDGYVVHQSRKPG